jgi:beta-glucosidase
VREGTLAETDLDDLVAPMLAAKFRVGLFDDPFVDPDHAERVVASEANAALALQAARETITLLANDGVLPLDVAARRTVAVIGPNADRSLLGGYSGIPKHEVTVLEGVRRHVGDRARVVHAEGCRITIGGSWVQDEVLPADPDEDSRLIAQAVEVAREADVIVLVIGGNEQTSREAWSRRHMGDATTLELVGRQNELVDAMVATGKPVVALLFNGRPMAINHLVGSGVRAIAECWYLGQETGRAVAEALFGDFSPSGKLPISFPRSAGHVPVFYNHKPSARRGYLWDDASPLFPFGFGLSYTTFALGPARLADERMARDGSTRVLVDVTNTGSRSGAEVVQVYVRDRVSTVTRPVKELKGFEKVWLAPGETTTVEIPLTPDSLAFHDIDMRWVVEPGEFTVMVGTSSRDADLQSLTLTVER